MLPYLLVSPYLLFVIVFVVFPVLFCFFLTFNKWNIIAPMHFIGMDNYSRLFHDRLVLESHCKYFKIFIAAHSFAIGSIIISGLIAQSKNKSQQLFSGHLFLCRLLFRVW